MTNVFSFIANTVALSDVKLQILKKNESIT